MLLKDLQIILFLVLKPNDNEVHFTVLLFPDIKYKSCTFFPTFPFFTNKEHEMGIRSGVKIKLFLNGEFQNYQQEAECIHPFIYSFNKYLQWGCVFSGDSVPKSVLANVECGENHHRKSFKWPIVYSLLGFVYIILSFSKSNAAHSCQDQDMVLFLWPSSR